MENIPHDLSLPMDGGPHLPLSVGFHTLLDQAKHSVEVVSPVWNLNPWDQETTPSTAKQVQSQPVCIYPRIPAEHEPTTFPSCPVREMQLFSSTSACSLLMRLVLLRCKYGPFKRHPEMLLRYYTLTQNITLFLRVSCCSRDCSAWNLVGLNWRLPTVLLTLPNWRPWQRTVSGCHIFIL